MTEETICGPVSSLLSLREKWAYFLASVRSPALIAFAAALPHSVSSFMHIVSLRITAATMT